MGAYNAEKYINEAIESILKQTFKNFEFIIIDDCSNDDTLNLIKNYAHQDNRINLIQNKVNKGLTKSLNIGIEHAKGKYIARMDADDISHPERLKTQYNFLEKNEEIILVGTSGFTINENGDIIEERDVPLTHKEIEKVIMVVNPMIHSSVMFRKEKIRYIGGYNEDFKKVQDYELWFRSIYNEYRMANLSDRLIYYRTNNKYFERKSLNYRMTALKIRWKGYGLLKTPFYKRYGILIPIFLALAPNWFLKCSYKFLKRFDPRQY